MPKSQAIIKAIFKDGAFRPLEPVDLPENRLVVLDISYSPEEDKIDIDKLFERSQANMSRFTESEIEKDILDTIKEIRKSR